MSLLFMLLQHQFMDWVLMDSKKKFVARIPINMYTYSKFLFDQYVRRIFKNKTSQDS